MLVTDAAFIFAVEPDRGGKGDLCLRLALDIDLGRDTRIAGVAPIGFPARLKLYLQSASQFAIPDFSRAIILNDDTNTPARCLRPVGGRCLGWKHRNGEQNGGEGEDANSHGGRMERKMAASSPIMPPDNVAMIAGI